MMRFDARRIGALLSFAVLAACGGGGGGSDFVSLKARDDVVREAANVVYLYIDNGGGTAASGGANAAGRSIGAKGLAARTLSGRGGIVAKNAAPKATAACHSGSYTYDNFYGVARSLPLFAVAPTVDYYAEANNDCRFIEGTYSEYYDGSFEQGDNAAYTGGTAEAPLYDYMSDGSGGTPFRVVLQDTSYDEKLTVTTLGRVETRDTGTSYESREIFALDLAYSYPGDSFKMSIDTGADAVPLVFVDNYGGDGSVSIDGPLSYGSSFCDGGALEYDTLENLTFASDGSGTYVNGGELVITSGDASVALVFADNGDVQYTFSGGGSGVVTRSEVNNAVGECVFSL